VRFARATTLALMMALFVGCAHIEAPSGGPEDKDPPRVVATFPDSGAVGVAAGDSLAIVFSEPMNRRTVEKSFFISPPVTYHERSWRGETWILRLADSLRSDRTYVALLGTGAKDRHNLSPAAPWSFPFSTGESLDAGRVQGQVVGVRLPGRGSMVYAWPWETPPPDTTQEGFPPDPLRLGQADAKGDYALDYLPLNVPLRICALFDRQADQRFDPGTDRWTCLPDPVELSDSVRTATGVALFLADADEPGVVAGSVVDSVCILSRARQELATARARADSLREWMGAPEDAVPPDEPSPAWEGGVSGRRRVWSSEDSLRVGSELLAIDAIIGPAAAESAFCALPVIAQLVQILDTSGTRGEGAQSSEGSNDPARGSGSGAAGDAGGSGDATDAAIADTLGTPDTSTNGGTEVIAYEGTAAPEFRFTDVAPGIYRLRAFRDVNGDGAPQPDEPQVWYSFALEVRPLRVLDGLRLVLRKAPGPDTPPGTE